MLDQCCKWKGLTNQTEKFDQHERLWSLHKSPHADVSYGGQDGTNHLWMDSDNGPPGIVMAMIASCRTVFPRYVRHLFFWLDILLLTLIVASAAAQLGSLNSKICPRNCNGLSSVVISYELAISWHYGKAQFKESWRYLEWDSSATGGFPATFRISPYSLPMWQLFPNSVLGDCYLYIYIYKS